MPILAALAAIVCIALVFLGLLLVSRRRRKNAVYLLLVFQVADGSLNLYLQGSPSMKKISNSVLYFIISALAITDAGINAAVDGFISVVSSDPNVLLVTPQVDGMFHITVVGVGRATLTVSGDADLGDGVRQVNTVFEYEVYDDADKADHFDISTTEIAYRDGTFSVTGVAPAVVATEETAATS